MQPDRFQILAISLVLVKNPANGKYLAVLEKNNTWWLPGGRVDAPEFYSQGAIRQCKQQAGVDIELKGLLRFQHSPSTHFMRTRAIFYAEPKDHNQPPKSQPDSQSRGAKYMTVQQILKVKSTWRGSQLYEWANYVQKGGKIFPLTMLQEKR